VYSYPDFKEILSESMISELEGIVRGDFDQANWEDLIDTMESASGRPIFYTEREDYHGKTGFISEDDIEKAITSAVENAPKAVPINFTECVVRTGIWSEIEPVSGVIIERVQLAVELLKKWSTKKEAPAKTETLKDIVICHPFSLSETSCYLVFGCGIDIPQEIKESLLKTVNSRPIQDYMYLSEFNSTYIPDEIWRGEDNGYFYNQVEAATTPDRIIKVSPELIERTILRLTPNKAVILEVCLKGSLAIPVNLVWATTYRQNRLVAYVESRDIMNDRKIEAINKVLAYIGKEIGICKPNWSAWSREYQQVPLGSPEGNQLKEPLTGFVSTLSLSPEGKTFNA
jgi:hypothetical protein